MTALTFHSWCSFFCNYELIFDRLKKDGLSENAIEQIVWKNALRVIKDVL